MKFELAMSPMAWIWAFVIAAVMLLMPLMLAGMFAENFSEPLRSIINVISSFILAPAVVCYLYHRKMMKSGRGSVIFWFYVGLYSLLFVMYVYKLVNEPFTFEAVLSPIVLAVVAVFLVRFAWKTKSKLGSIQNQNYVNQREEDIDRQAEAILRAEEIKKRNEELEVS